MAHPEGAIAYHPDNPRTPKTPPNDGLFSILSDQRKRQERLKSTGPKPTGSIVLLPTRLSDSGYHKVRLTNADSERVAWLLHHIIYLTFNGELPPRSSGSRKKDRENPTLINHPLYSMVVMHMDDVRDHNQASNLQLGTQKENRKMIGRTHRNFAD